MDIEIRSDSPRLMTVRLILLLSNSLLAYTLLFPFLPSPCFIFFALIAFTFPFCCYARFVFVSQVCWKYRRASFFLPPYRIRTVYTIQRQNFIFFVFSFFNFIFLLPISRSAMHLVRPLVPYNT